MTQAAAPVEFEAEPQRYHHWRLEIQGEVARLIWDVQEGGGLRPGYALKLNSYDLGVDIELADVVQRLRFEHPEVRCVIITGATDRVVCAGANIHMLGSSTHAFKVNFCKFTNETRLSIEDASRNSGQKYLAALNGTTAGGGYELALACDQMVHVDDLVLEFHVGAAPPILPVPGAGQVDFEMISSCKHWRQRCPSGVLPSSSA